MATCTLQNVFDTARGFLHDTDPPQGAVWNNAALQVHFAEPYRTMFARLVGASKRIQRVVYVGLPASTSVLVPQAAGITDLSEPEMVEERPSPGTLPITGTSGLAGDPVVINIPSHGLGNAGAIVQGVVTGVSGTFVPWGSWFATIADADNLTLNGSWSDGVAGTGGTFFSSSTQPFTEVFPIDLTAAGLDGTPSQVLGNYLWINSMFQFRGAGSDIQLRITYYASGAPPVNPATVIGIDNALDFLSVATAANAARANSWPEMANALRAQAYGDPTHPEVPALIDLFYIQQVTASQRGPQRRQQPFRDKRSRYGSYVMG